MKRNYGALMEYLRGTVPPPTWQEIGARFGVEGSTAGLWLSALETAGLIERDRKTARGVRLTERGRRIPLADVAYAVDRALLEARHGRTA